MNIVKFNSGNKDIIIIMCIPYSPNDVVDTDYVLFLSVLVVTHNGRARLHPRVATVLVHQSVVMR